MQYKLIATDIDGTLITDSHALGESTIAAIKKALDHGIKVVLCSGRSPATIKQYEDQIGLSVAGNYGIGFNGASVYEADTRKVIYGETIAQATAQQIVEAIKKVSDQVKIAFYLENNLLIAEEGLEKVLAIYGNNTDVTMKFYPQIKKEHITSHVLNLYIIQYRDILLPVYEALSKENFSGVNMAFTQKDLIEFMPQAMNKAQGLKALTKHLGIEMDQVVAVGDNYNDIEMIRESGYGVAVSNAVEELKTVADYITRRDNNKDALEEVVDLVIELNN